MELLLGLAIGAVIGAVVGWILSQSRLTREHGRLRETLARLQAQLRAESISQTASFVLLSTSATAKRYWDIRYWHELAEFLGSSVGTQKR